MRALSLTQPWATLVANGLKKIETRSWKTNFRGEFAIHAAKAYPRWAKNLPLDDPFFANALASLGLTNHSELPLGSIVAVASLVAILPTSGYLKFHSQVQLTVNGRSTPPKSVNVHYERPAEGTPEFAFGDYSEGRFMYFLENIWKLPEPIPCTGALSLWTVPEGVEAEIRQQFSRRKAA